MTIDVEFLDSGHEPECKADPLYPDGKRVNFAPHALAKTCTRNLPYPAPRCGLYRITCKTCNMTALVSVAGRADDPSMVTMPCKRLDA